MEKLLGLPQHRLSALLVSACTALVALWVMLRKKHHSPQVEDESSDDWDQMLGI